MKKMWLALIGCAAAAAVLWLPATALAQHKGGKGKGDNRDDKHSGKSDRKGDGNSGQGDDLHRKYKGGDDNGGGLPPRKHRKPGDEDGDGHRMPPQPPQKGDGHEGGFEGKKKKEGG